MKYSMFIVSALILNLSIAHAEKGGASGGGGNGETVNCVNRVYTTASDEQSLNTARYVNECKIARGIAECITSSLNSGVDPMENALLADAGMIYKACAAAQTLR